MKLLKYLFLLLSVQYLFGSDYSKSLNLFIDIDKNTFQQYESIYGIIKLVNTSETTLKISPHFHLGSNILKLRCKKKSGKEYSGHSISADIVGPTASYELHPGDSLLHSFNLLYSFGEKDRNNLHLYYLPEGEYLLIAEFKPGYSYKNKSRNFEVLYSNKFSFKVINNPLSKNEEQTFQNLVQIIHKRDVNRAIEKNRDKRSKITKQFINELKDIIGSYPNSIFIDIPFSRLLYYEPMNKDIFFKAIDKYHNSYFFGYKLPGMIAGENQKYEGIYLKYLKEKYPNSLGSHYMDYFLNKNEKFYKKH